MWSEFFDEWLLDKNEQAKYVAIPAIIIVLCK